MPEGKMVVIPDEIRRFLPTPTPSLSVQPAGPPLPTPDSVLDLAHLLALLQGHDVRPFAGRWIAPRHLLVLNTALSYPDPAAITARSELQTGYLRFLHYLAEAACLIAPVAGLLKPTPAAWDWLDLSEAQRWQLLWDGWQADLRRSPREAALWQRFRLPAKPSFVRTLLDTLSTLPGEGWMASTALAGRLRGHCIGAGTLPRDGDALAPLQALLAGPLTWAALVHTAPGGAEAPKRGDESSLLPCSSAPLPSCFALTPLGDWLLRRSADSPETPPSRPVTIHCPGDDHLIIIMLPEPLDRPPLRSLIELPLAPEARLTRHLTCERFVAALAHGLTRAWMVQMLSELTGGPLSPAALGRLEMWEAQARGLTLRRLTVVTAADPQVLAQLSTQRTIRPHFRETLSPHHVAVDPAGVERLLRALRRRGHTPLVEPAYPPNPPPCEGRGSTSPLPASGRGLDLPPQPPSLRGKGESPLPASGRGLDLPPPPPSLRGKGESPLPASGRGRGRGALDAGAAAYLWLALRTYLALADLVRLPAVPPVALLDRLGDTLDADQLAAVAAQAEQASRRLRDILDGYTPFPAPIAGVDHAAIQAVIEQALEEGTAVEIVYHTAGRGERTTRVVEPLRLDERGGALYLVAYCRLRQAERVFRLDRIESVVSSQWLATNN